MQYHIKPDGTPAPCHAKLGQCPYGDSTEHFDSLEKALEFSQGHMEKEFAQSLKTPERDNREKRFESLLDDHWKTVQERFGKDKVLSVALYGSQNYKVDTPASDVDTYAILGLSFSELYQKKSYSLECKVDDAISNVKDINSMVYNIKKSNINFLETLFTPYKRINREYGELFDELYKNGERIALSNKNQLIRASCGMIFNNSRRGKPKAIANNLRLQNFILAIEDGESFENAIVSEKVHSLEEIKSTKQGNISEKELRDMDKNLIRFATDRIYSMKYNKYPVDKEALLFLDDWGERLELRYLGKTEGILKGKL